MTVSSVGCAQPCVSARTQDAAANESESLLPSPPEVRATPDLLMELQRLLLQSKDDSVTRGENRIRRHEAIALKASEDAHQARLDAIEKRSSDGGFFDGIGTALEAFTVDLATLDTLTDPFGQLERSCDKAGSAIDTPQFWADLQSGALEVGKWVGVAASCALAVASAGAATPLCALAIAGAVLSCAAAASSTFHLPEKLGADAETAGWVNLGLSLGSAACSGLSGVAQAAGSTMAASATEAAVKYGSTVGSMVSAGASGTAAVARVNVAAFERDAKMADAEAVEATARQQSHERRVQALLTTLKETIDSTGRGLARVNQAATDYQATRVAMMRA